MEHKKWFEIDNISDFDSPALVVYPSRAIQNIQVLKSMVSSVENLRPHVKTHKMLEIAQMLINEGIFKFKCATIAEAEMLGMAGAKDTLLAYQPVGPKIKRLAKLIRKFPSVKYSCLIDSPVAAEGISGVMKDEGLELPVFIDLNVGMNRTGIAPSKGLELFEIIQGLPNLKPIGLHAYDGHIRDTDFKKRKDACDAAFMHVTVLKAVIHEKYKINPVIVAGGSPTFPIHAKREEVECSPGTFIFWDWGYKNILPELDFDFAALVVARIISIPSNDTLCLDLGHKAVAADPPLPRVKFLNAEEALPISQSEEHLVVKVPDAKVYTIGDVFYGAPVHICPTCALHEKALIVKDNIINGFWKVASRERAINI